MIPAHRPRTNIAGQLDLRDPTDGARDADPKMLRSPTPRHAAFDRRNDPVAKVRGKRLSHTTGLLAGFKAESNFP